MIATSLPAALRHLAHQRRAVDVVLRLAVREVQAHHVDAGADHALEHLGRARGGAEGGDDLGGAGHGSLRLGCCDYRGAVLQAARATGMTVMPVRARRRGSRRPAASCPPAPRGRRRRRSRCSRRRFSMPYLAIAASVSPPPAMLNALRRGDRARDRLGAVGEGVELEHADRAVPDDGAGRLQLRRPAAPRSAGRCRGSGRRRSTSAAAFTVAGASAVNSLAVTTSTGIGTAAPRAFIASITALASSTQVGLGQALADRQARGEHEGVGDAAADDQLVDLLRPAPAGSSAWCDLASRRRSPPAAASGWPAPS